MNEVNTRVSLDFEQRQRASALEESVAIDELAAAYELIYLRDTVTQMRSALIAAEADLSASVLLIRKALIEKVPRD